MKSIGVIGCGRVARVRYIPEYTDHRDARLHAFYDLNPEWVRELAGTYAGRAYGIYGELLEDERIDAVFIRVPSEFHAEISIAALKAGRNVPYEKPMAVTLEECRQIAEAVEETGKCLMIGQNQRLTKGHVLTRKLIEYRGIGKVITFKTTFGHGGLETWNIDPGSNTWFFDKKKVAMGAMADLGIHRVDLIQYLTGEYVVETTAVIIILSKRDGSGNLIGVDDNAICVRKMESGVMGTMTASWIYCSQGDNSIMLYGSKGIVHVHEDSECCVKIIKPDNEVAPYNIDQIQASDGQTELGVIDAFMDCIVRGREAQPDGKGIPSAVEAVFASIESAKTGKTIKID